MQLSEIPTPTNYAEIGQHVNAEDFRCEVDIISMCKHAHEEKSLKAYTVALDMGRCIF